MALRKLSIEIKVIQWIGENFQEIISFCPLAIDMGSVTGNDNKVLSWPLLIPTLEGNRIAMIGDYIIKGIKGEFYLCKPDIFVRIYEPSPPTCILPVCPECENRGFIIKGNADDGINETPCPRCNPRELHSASVELNPYLKITAPWWARLIVAIEIIFNRKIRIRLSQIFLDGKQLFEEEKDEIPLPEVENMQTNGAWRLR